MRWLIWLVLTVSAAVGLALLMRFNHGNVAILWPPWRVDLSVNLVVVLIAGAFLALHIILVALGKALELPIRVRNYRERKAREQSVVALRDAILALFEGRFGRAERLAQQAREQVDLAAPAALIAARAAHRMREPARRDRWVEAIDASSMLDAAKRVTQAEFALDDGRPMDAVQSLAALQQGGARHIHSLRLNLKAAEQAGDWTKVLHLTRQLAKRDAIHPTAARGLRVRSVRALCAGLSQADEAERLYAQLPSEEQREPEVVEAVVAAMTRTGATKAAWKLIEETLSERWSPGLARRFVDLQGLSARDKLMRAERWLERYPDECELHLLLGELCAQESLWGKAEAFFKKASLNPLTAAQAHLQWALLNEQLRRPALAAEHFRRSALLAAGLSDTAPTVDFEAGSGDELSLVGSEEQRRLSDIARLGQAAQGD